ncbi:MAG: DUF1573 domain-containing protein [Spirosomaceae bacterium]|jgi:hypothetical protein|nr:DUF1573 domain-containing protein [Spirosomataceae bacterium]
MKKVFLFFAAFFVFAAVSFAQKGVIKFTKSENDFGKIEQGKPVTYNFEFTNNGPDPIVLGNVSASCGCTTPEWSREPILQNKKGFVKATFNAGSMGVFNKTVTVPSNAENGTVYLTLKGEVVANKTAADPKKVTN